MSFLYATADPVGGWTGGGKVTANESQALLGLGDPCEILGARELGALRTPAEPWGWDEGLVKLLRRRAVSAEPLPRLAHFYSGTFTESVEQLLSFGVKVVYTVAAHDVRVSWEEHLRLGLPFDYPHLTQQAGWWRYCGGYVAADAVVVPSTYSEKIMRMYGCRNRVEVIPHGVDLPDAVRPRAAGGRFTVGYLGAVGPDKGLVYLLQAWKQLNYDDAVLVLAGRDSTGPWVNHLLRYVGGGNVRLLGWVNDVSDFYDSIDLYVQPSASEGFGIEVLEALAHGRPALVSAAAGAADVVPEQCRFPPRDADALANVLRRFRDTPAAGRPDPDHCRARAEQYTWAGVRTRYQALWREVLS